MVCPFWENNLFTILIGYGVTVLTNLCFFGTDIYMAFVPSSIMDKKRVISTSDRSQCGKTKASRFVRSRTDHPVDKLCEPKFRAHFHIPDSIVI